MAKTLTELALDAVAELRSNNSPHSAALADWIEATAAEAGAAPASVTAPYASQSGSTLNCTMGTWSSEPSSYAWQWLVEGAEVTNGTAADYTVLPADVGYNFTCVVTATNVAGSGTATSNNVVAA